MTADRPAGAELLAEARRTLLEVLLPLLPAERRYDGLMVANAMAIVARELDAREPGTREMLAALLAALQQPEPSGEPPSAPEETLARLEARLARDIRGGRYDADDDRRAAVRRYLQAATIARLRLSNPKLLGG